MAIVKISECVIKPEHIVETAKHHCYLGPTDLVMLSMDYMQKGFLFVKPPPTNNQEVLVPVLLEKLKRSLSIALTHFYPLAGQLETQVNERNHSCLVCINCNKGRGARLIHATVDITMSNILSPVDVPLVVQSLFDLGERTINHDGHTKPLLSIQVTELVDAIFIGCCMNHSVADGTSLWHFIDVWSKIFETNCEDTLISNLPIHQRWFLDGYDPRINLPYIHPDEYITRWEPPQLRERIFHFSPDSMAKLKATANAEQGAHDISSFQALSALIWRSITRARCLESNQETCCWIVASSRHKLNPPLPNESLCNALYGPNVTLMTSELLGSGLGHAARLLNQAIKNQGVSDWMKSWMESPFIPKTGWTSPNSVLIGGSPRLGTYGPLFGLGQAKAIRSGYGNKFDGKVTTNVGTQGRGSVIVEVCLLPHVMSALEADEEFTAAFILPSHA